MRLAALLALTALVAPTAVDAKCAMDNQAWDVMTPEVSVPADGGGILVGTFSVPYSVPARGDALQKSWGFITGRDLLQPVITVLAPGLVVYGVPKGSRTTGELTDGKGTIAKLTVTTDMVARLPSPKLKAVEHRDDGPNQIKRSQSTTVILDGVAPADAVALVLFDGSKKPMSWGAVKAGDTSVEVYGHRRCEVLPNGTIASKAGDKVTLAWVDKYGRLSGPTKLVTIKVGR